ncbi:hypothetical protein ACWOAH_09160 [Vagococcus vulneris]|uniref:Uncharacterized protein n=1 Tax=Vagococcus vulneris TaxID=1977869 RepID=A0A430A1S0_9ENTE|nr:hypothetical protein [Vagococcus vulneris]RSU00289.1 hypothetical protein CBF37_03045 [Vagococcus vulneris]
MLLLTEISVAYWSKAEKLVNSWFSLEIMIVSVLILVLFFAVIYANNHFKKILISIMAGIIIFTGITVAFGSSYSKSYRQLAKYVSPVNRNVMPKSFGYEYVGDRRGSYVLVADVTKTLKLPFYKKEVHEVVNPEFLGGNEYLYFFKIDNYIYSISKKEPSLQLSDKIDKMIIKQETAVLKFKEYETIGFLDQVGPANQQVILPKSKITQQYEPNTKVYDFKI